MERIASLVHALPPPGVEIDVADLPGTQGAVEWLNAHGRPARLVSAPEEAVETRLWRPSPTLLPLSEWLVSERGPGGEAKKSLDLGCGTGRDAVYLALQGWQVTAVDHLPDALDRARSLADLHNVTLDLQRLDIENDALPEGPFDLVTAFRYLPSLEKMASVLAPGGTLLVETFTDRERERAGKPRDPRLVLPSAGPPCLPAGLTLADYRVADDQGRELATLRATAPSL